ncbi:MAG: YkgJ family cysteine cluster protein [Crocinitomicaceae bacterium]|nr:YkgJ family cysteine cluster protein [Crocinitomicaceae bacterium]
MEKKHKEWMEQAVAKKDEITKQLKIFQKKKPKNLDTIFHTAHQKAFSKIDCLKCANCCKTTSPIFRPIDIQRISNHLRMTEGNFIKKYLRIDEDNDYVLQQSPCAFLNDDNTCSIYEHRPLACREYPHTDRKNMYQIMDLTRKNAAICPAVSQILTEIVK